MSSGGSVSTTGSRLRQFGLYRTIDERTEEFLRLSRKRQLRQGCACAAISTAVTVTIVICFILMHKYHAISEKSEHITKQSWLSLVMNSSAKVFDTNLSLTKKHVDKSSNKLLPLILKKMKVSGHFDQTDEDFTANDNVATESYYSNASSKTKTWMKSPISKLYSFIYKTSPLAYFKSPTRNLDYYTKIRKIRDYQRIMDYIDKMISEKVTLRSTIPISKTSTGAIPDINHTTPMAHILSKIQYETGRSRKKYDAELNKKKCYKCQLQMSKLVSKIIACLQKTIPDFFNVTLDNFTTVTSNFIDDTVSKASKRKVNTIPNKELDFLYTSDPNYKSYQLTKNVKPHNRLPSILSLIKPIPKNLNKKTNYFQQKTIIPLNKKVTSTSRKKLRNEMMERIYKVADNFMKNNSKYTFSLYKEEIEEDYLELNKNIIEDNRTHNSDKYIFQKPKHRNDYLKGETENKMDPYMEDAHAKLTKYPRFSTSLVSEATTTKTVNKKISNTVFHKSLSNKLAMSPSKTPKSVVHNSVKYISVGEKNTRSTINSTEEFINLHYDATIEEETEKPEITNEDVSFKSLANILISINNSLRAYSKPETTESLHLKLLGIDDKPNNYSKPTIIQVRPSYLEIKRHNWRHEDINEYDNFNK